MLGKGAFGEVFVSSHLSTGKKSAVKLVDTSRCEEGQATSKKLEKAAQEVDVWRAVGKHPHIVELQGSFTDGACMLIVMEMCECSVAQKLMSSPSLLKSGLNRLFSEMLMGLQACHQARVVHRDVKLDNFLIGGGSHGGSCVKLCDFGLAAMLPPHGGGLWGVCGTAHLMSPEMLQGVAYGCGTDVWSFGAMAYSLTFGEFPYVPKEWTAKAAKAATLSGDPKPRWLECRKGNEVTDFLGSLLERDPGQRASAAVALGHPYLRDSPLEAEASPLQSTLVLPDGCDPAIVWQSDASGDASSLTL